MSIHKRLVVLVGCLLLLASCASSGNPGAGPVSTQPPTSTVTIMPTPTPTVPPLGPVPPNCSVSHPTPRSISPKLAPVIGVSPVWATWPAGPSIFHLSPSNNYANTYLPPYGWGMKKVIWEVGPNYTHPVTVRGHELFNNMPLLVQFLQNTPTADAVLDPQHPNHPIPAFGEGWAEWGSLIVVPKAGCYTMEVSWPTGQWSVTFAFGA